MPSDLIQLASPGAIVTAVPGRPNLLGVDTDAQAIGAWLTARAGRSRHTFVSYQHEARRLVAWMGERGLALQSMTVVDAQAFLDHLRAPPPHWIRSRKLRHSDAVLSTQLMMGPLSDTAIQLARTILTQLFGYLCDAGYLKDGNPFKLTARPAVVLTTTQERYLEQLAWQHLWGWLCRPESDLTHHDAGAAKARDRWLIALLYHSGLRLSEAASCRMGDFVRRDGGWQLRVVGKRNKERFVTVNSVLLEELRLFRAELRKRRPGLETPLPVPGETWPLACSIQPSRTAALTPRFIRDLVQQAMRAAAETAEDPHIAERLKLATPHWMRHTNATHRLAAGASLLTTQDELGHADPKTTRIYAAVSSKARQKDAELLANIEGSNEAPPG